MARECLVTTNRRVRPCAVDARGRDVFAGDAVIDSMGCEHVVTGFCPIPGTRAAWLLAEDHTALVPHLVEKVVGDVRDQ